MLVGPGEVYTFASQQEKRKGCELQAGGVPSYGRAS